MAMDSTRQPLAVKTPHGRPDGSRAYLGNLTSRLIISCHQDRDPAVLALFVGARWLRVLFAEVVSREAHARFLTSPLIQTHVEKHERQRTC
jgi:hypothetical protein